MNGPVELDQRNLVFNPRSETPYSQVDTLTGSVTAKDSKNHFNNFEEAVREVDTQKSRGLQTAYGQRTTSQTKSFN